MQSCSNDIGHRKEFELAANGSIFFQTEAVPVSPGWYRDLQTYYITSPRVGEAVHLRCIKV